MTTSSIRRRFDFLVVAVALGVMANLSGCGTPKEDYFDAVDEHCGEVNEKFGKELSIAVDSFGAPDHLDKLAKRIEAVKLLRTEVYELEPPEGTARPDDWLAKLDAYIKEMEKLLNLYRNATPGSDLVLAMSVGIHDDAAVAAGKAAATVGLDTCAKVDTWQIFPG